MQNNLLEIIKANNLWESSISLKRKDILINIYDLNTNIYFVEKGCLVISTPIGELDQIIRLCYRGSLFVALDSFLYSQPTRYEIYAIKSSVIKVIPKSLFFNFIQQQELLLQWTDILYDLIRQQSEREIDLLTPSAKERYERVLKRSPQLFQEVPHKYIANYLGIQPETLSRLLKS